MVIGTVADLEYNGIALVAAHEIVHDVFEIIDVILHLTGLFHAVRVLVQTPRQHGSGICHREIEFHMVAGIVPAAVDLVNDVGVTLPLDTVPLRQIASLLALVEKERHLQRLGVVGVSAGGRDRCSGNGAKQHRCRKDCGSQTFFHT